MNKKDRQQLVSMVRALQVLSARLADKAPDVNMQDSSIEPMSASEFAKYLSYELSKLVREGNT